MKLSIYEAVRPENFARTMSGTIHFYLRTCPFYHEQVTLTCQAIPQLLLVSGQSMTYQFASMFRKQSIPFVRIVEIGQCQKREVFYGHFFPVYLGRTCHSPWRTCPLYFEQVPGLRVWPKICSGLAVHVTPDYPSTSMQYEAPFRGNIKNWTNNFSNFWM